MSTPAPAETSTTTAPAPAEFSLAAFRKGEITAKGESTAKPSVEAKPVVDEAPDPEVEADPELAKAIDEIEKPTDNESPAEKAARTKRHKEAARKGYATRQKNRADRAEQRAADLERELNDARRQPPSGRREEPAAPRPAPQAEPDPSDPEPTLESVTAKHPTDPDPYGRLQRELAAWDRRQEARARDAERAQETQRQQAQRVHDQVGKHADHGRGHHPDYDAKIGALGALLHGHPADVVIAEALADITDVKVGSEVLYRAAAQLEDTKAAIRGGERALLRYLGRLERDITAAAAPPKAEPAAAPTVTKAPDPHTPVQGASTAAPVNPYRQPGTEFNLARAREWDRQHGSRRSA